VRSILISTDAGVRSALRRSFDDRGIELAMEIAVPFGQITEAHVTELTRSAPDVICLDFTEDPATAIGFARFLTEGNAHRVVIGTGPVLDADTLLEAMRAGVAEYLPTPVDELLATAALDRAARRLGWTPGDREPGQLFTVFSPKGGAGTTTLATNLAIVLHRTTGKRTLLVDLDLELGEVAVLLGLKPRFSLVDLAQGFDRMDAELLASFTERHESGIHLLAAPFHPELPGTIDPEQIRAILAFLKRHYDYVVVDTPKSFSPDTIAAFEEADRVLMLTTVGVPALRNLQRCKPVLERVFGKDSDRLRLVVNRYNVGDVISLADVQRSVGVDVHWTLSNDYEAVSLSINSATPVVQNPKSRYAQDLQALGLDLLGLRPGSNGSRRLSGSKLISGLVARLRGRVEEAAS